MEIHVQEHINTLHQFVHDLMFKELTSAPGGLHVLPTGKTFIVPYEQLGIRLLEISVQQAIKDKNEGGDPTHLDFSELRVLNIDEYLLNWKVIPPTDKRSFRLYMLPVVRALESLGFAARNHLFPDTPYGFNYNFRPYQLLTQFDEQVRALGQATSVFLGLGPPDSPHLAFSSPGYADKIGLPWEKIGAYVSPIDVATREANKSDSGMVSGPVPEYATTISPATLMMMRPKNVYLVAYGNKDLRPLLALKATDELDINLFPPAVLLLLEAQGSTIHIVTDRATWNNAMQ
jgi:hypothetical protein